MNTYTITYRKSNGNTETTTVQAATEAAARSAFFARFDGRIITVEA